MKKSVRLFITGSVQPTFFNRYVKENADKLNIRGFIRTLEDGRVEVFLEGDVDTVSKMIPICERGHKHSIIRSVQQKEERFQDFKNFKVLNI